MTTPESTPRPGSDTVEPAAGFAASSTDSAVRKNHDGPHAWREDGTCGIAFCTADRLWGDLAPGGSCYICGDPRDHDGLPHGDITRQQFDMIRAKTELGVIEDLLDRVYVNRALLISRQRTLKRRVLDLQQVLNG